MSLISCDGRVTLADNGSLRYFTGFFSTTLATPGAYNFVINMMSNHSAEEPTGYFNVDMFKQFFSLTGEGNDLTYTPGHERIPENWYRRPLINQYTVPNVLQVRSSSSS